MRIEDGSQPQTYSEEHPYRDDPVLPGLLERILPSTVNDELNEDLARLGHVLIRGAFEHTYLPSMSNALSDVRSLAPLVQPASLTQYNEFDQRVDRLHTSEGWRELKDFAVREGYTAIAYERKCEEHNRTY